VRGGRTARMACSPLQERGKTIFNVLEMPLNFTFIKI